MPKENVALSRIETRVNISRGEKHHPIQLQALYRVVLLVLHGF